eukprot:gene24400-29496_t
MEALANILQKQDKLRFYCSDIAALTGFHPYADITEVFMKYLYQDIELLQEADAQALGIELLSVEESADRVLLLLDQEVQNNFQALLQKTSDKAQLSSQSQAKELISNMQNLLRDNKVTSKLSIEEFEVISKEFSGRIRKQYGVHCEAQALEKYTDMTGYAVTMSNDKTYVYEVFPEHLSPIVRMSNTSIRDPSPPPHTTSTSSSSSIVIDLTKSADLGSASASVGNNKAADDLSKGNPPPAKRKRKQTTLTGEAIVDSTASAVKKASPLFKIIGKIDGLSVQPLVQTTASGALDVKDTIVVVEVKNRVRGFSTPPPLYEMIQVVSYMIMLGAEYADLVQAMLVTPTADSSSESDQSSSIQIHRICLHDPLYNHHYTYTHTILPRLLCFKEAICKMRQEVGLRYAYLMGEREEREAIVKDLCPYFR